MIRFIVSYYQKSKISKWYQRYFEGEKIPQNKLDSYLRIYINNGSLSKVKDKIKEDREAQKKENHELWCTHMQYLEKKYIDIKLRVSSTPDITATIVEAREHKHFKAVVKNLIHNTEHLNIGLHIFHGTKNEKYVKDALQGVANVKFTDLGVENLDIEAYNKIMLSKKFLNAIETEKFIVFQTDVITFKKLDSEFLKYDYIGAPWSKNNHKEYKASVGNGGLSIRKKKVMLEILDLKIPRKPLQPEDLYLAQILKSHNFKLPSFVKAKSFATEDIYTLDTFGCHKSWELRTKKQLTNLLKQH